MKLSELDQLTFEASQAASNQVRSLALAGLAIVWLFAGPFFEGKATETPSSLLFGAGVALTASLALDVVQLIGRTALLEWAYQRANKGSDPDVDPEVGQTPGVTVVTATLFYSKSVALALGYGLVVAFFCTKAF